MKMKISQIQSFSQ